MAGDQSPKDFPRVMGDFIDCPHCGCPNRPTDNLCSFCAKNLSSSPGVSSRIRKAVERMKWRYKMRRGHAPTGRSVAASVMTLVLGLSLAALGGYFTLQGITGGSVSWTLIGGIFVAYGLYSVAFILKVVGK